MNRSFRIEGKTYIDVLLALGDSSLENIVPYRGGDLPLPPHTEPVSSRMRNIVSKSIQSLIFSREPYVSFAFHGVLP